MKRLLIYIIVSASLLQGCQKKSDELFSQSPDKRITEALNSYKTALMQAPGWKLFVYPEGLLSEDIEVGGLTYYVTFPDSNRVRMVSDFNTEMSSVPKESGFSLAAVQRPSIRFDTYSYIHVVADPDEEVSFSPTQSGGFGWGSDFDFAFTEKTPGDTIRLKGNFNNSDALMIRATQQEITDAFSGGLADIIEATQAYNASTPFLYFPASDNSKVGVSFNLYLIKVNFTTVTGSNVNIISAPFSRTLTGLHFKNPVTVGGYTFQDLFWDAALQVYYLNASSGRVNIVSSSTPPFPFNILLGKTITTVRVPVTPLDGQSAAFADMYAELKNNLKSGGFNLDLSIIDFIFDDQSKTMALHAYVQQDGYPFIIRYVYSYSLNSSNITRFIRVGANANGVSTEDDMRPLLDYLDNRFFKVDFFTGVSPAIGQFTSQDDPQFFFTGNLQ